MANPKCPRCGSTNTAEIIYGMPAFGEEPEKQLDAGTVVLVAAWFMNGSHGSGVMPVKGLLERLRSPKMAQSLCR